MRLLELFKSPTAEYRGKPFWAWNDKIEEERVRRQLRIFKRMGLGGGFIHSRVGLKTPYLSDEWFSMVKACVDEAKKIGLQIWLYDEDRWASGAAGGLVTKDPKYRMRYITWQRFEFPERYIWPEKEEGVFVFGVVFEDDGTINWYKRLDQPADILILPPRAEILEFKVELVETSSWYNYQTYLDVLNEEAVRKFIEVTYEAYKRHCGDEFGGVIPGIFTDEANMEMSFITGSGIGPDRLPWTDTLPARFEQMFGYDITRCLPELVYDPAGGKFSQARYHYYVCKTRMFVEAFSRQIGRWCEENNLLFTGHWLIENSLPAQAGLSGSVMQLAAYMHAPGVDILTQYSMEYTTLKQCASVVRQLGRKWMLSELYGCTGWETTFEAYKFMGDWQACLGVNLRCQHLSYYSMAGEAKRDYPASIHIHSPWWQEYKFVEDYFGRLNVLLSEGEPICKLAVIHPIESYYLLLRKFSSLDEARDVFDLEKKHHDIVRILLEGHIDFDFADEHLLVELQSHVGEDKEGPYLKIGKMKYRAVLVPPLITIRRTTLELLREFRKRGGQVVFVDKLPRCIDGLLSNELVEDEYEIVPLSYENIVPLFSEIRDVSVSIKKQELPNIFYQLRKIGDDWLLFLVNIDREKGYGPFDVKVNLELPRGGQIQYWDCMTGKRYKLAGELTYRTATFKLALPPSGSAMILISSEPDHSLELLPEYVEMERQEICKTSWSIKLDDYNPLVLDMADFEFYVDGKKRLSGKRKEILRLDNMIREELNLPPRTGRRAQPWVEKDLPLGPTGFLKLTFNFGVKYLPQEVVFVAIEQPERWRIELNGNLLPSEQIVGWWVDEAIKLLPIRPEYLIKGKNTLTVEGNFDKFADLEIIYILGRFGVEVKEKSANIVKSPTRLKLGNWVEQGLAFYSGNVLYEGEFDIKKNSDYRYFIEFPNFSATCIAIYVNGEFVGLISWPEYRIDITDQIVDGKNLLGVKLFGSRRNAFGPLHISIDKPRWIGPGSFIAPECFQEGYKLVPYGLYYPPVISIRRKR